MRSLKQKTAAGVKWSAIERFSVQSVQFLLGIIMARILSPDDYGLIGMLVVFMAVSQTFIDSGFSLALIWKVDRTETDFSTVFFFNLGVGIFCSVLLVVLSPHISAFFEEPELESITKVMALNLLVGALLVVQRAKLVISLDFKTQAKASLISAILSGLTGVGLAWSDFGVWALVWQTLMAGVLNACLLWYFVRWRPMLVFSGTAFRTLFRFGSKLLLSGLLNTIYNNLYQIIIGKRFSADALGNYTRAQQFANFPSSNITDVLQRVAFPILSEIRNDNERLVRFFRHFLRMTAFIVFPLMGGVIILAEPLIVTVLTVKWQGVVPLLQILCVSYLFYPVYSFNSNLLQIKGRSDLYLKLEIVKKVIITIALVLTVPLGVEAICAGIIATSAISCGATAYYAGKLVGFGFLKQVRELLPISFLTLFMFVVVYLITLLCETGIAKLIWGTLGGAAVYLGGACLLRSGELFEILRYIRKRGVADEGGDIYPD